MPSVKHSLLFLLSAVFMMTGSHAQAAGGLCKDLFVKETSSEDLSYLDRALEDMPQDEWPELYKEFSDTVTGAETVLERPITDDEKRGIIVAHLVGEGELGKDGISDATIDNYTEDQIMQKGLILKGLQTLSATEIRDLIQSGVVGFKKNDQRRNPLKQFASDVMMFIPRKIYGAMLATAETVGLPWLVPPSVDANIRAQVARGEIIGASASLLSVRLQSVRPALQNMVLGKVINPEPWPKLWADAEPRMGVHDFWPLSRFNNIYMPKTYSDSLAFELMRIHEGLHIVHSATFVKRMFNFLRVVVSVVAPGGRLARVPIRYISERAAMGSQWELYSRMSVGQRQSYIRELQNELAWTNSRYMKIVIPILIAELKYAGDPKIIYLAKVTHLHSYALHQIFWTEFKGTFFSPWGIAKLGVGIATYYYYPEVFTQIMSGMGF